MPNIFPIQDDFSSGEITPKMQGHIRSREYQTGLGLCENFEVTPQAALLQMRSRHALIPLFYGTMTVKMF